MLNAFIKTDWTPYPPANAWSARVASLHWSRELVARQILNDLGPMGRDRLKWEVALRFYGAEPKVRAMIRRQLDRVSD